MPGASLEVTTCLVWGPLLQWVVSRVCASWLFGRAAYLLVTFVCSLRDRAFSTSLLDVAWIVFPDSVLR